MKERIKIKFSSSRIDYSHITYCNNKSIGATVSFLGIIKNVNMNKSVKFVEYYVFESLAVELLEKKCSKFFLNKNLINISIIQRTGLVFVGDINIFLCISSNDRKTAFIVCKSLIEYIKHCIPIWKKEYYSDSSYLWINSI